MEKLEVKHSSINGRGLFAVKNIKKNERIATINGKIHVIRNPSAAASEKIQDWIGVGRYSWIDTSNSVFRYINHSCKPNSYIIGRRTVVAKTAIKKGEEVTMDYSFTEAEPEWHIAKCSCNNGNCRNLIGSIETLPRRVFNQNINFITKAFQQIYRVDNS